MAPERNLTELLRAWNAGDPSAPDQAMPLVYDELRSIARGHFQRDRLGHTLQATAIVDEAYQVYELEGLIPLDLPAKDGRLALPLPGFNVPVHLVEVEIALPANRSYSLATHKLEDQVGAPPRPPGVERSRLATVLKLPAAKEGVVERSHFAPAFATWVSASWYAMSPQLDNLVIEVKTDKEKRGWL